jgi:hypothetical protein
VYLFAVRGGRVQRLSRRVPPHLRPPVSAKNLAVFANLPLRERVTDRLSDALLAIDESIAMCEMEAEEARGSSWIAPELQSLYDAVSTLLNAIGD